jgi:MFS family permease
MGSRDVPPALEQGGDLEEVELRAQDDQQEVAAAAQTQKCDPCTRKAMCPMTCVSPSCRQHLISTLLLLLSFFLFADQQLVAPNMSQISRDFNLTDEERDLYLGGMVPLCFFAVGTPVTIFMGPIIDRVHRRNLFVGLIFLGETPCMCTWFVTSVTGLLCTRAITGIAMAAAEPLIFSMLSDMYGPKERNVMASVITIGQGAGLLAGQSLAGFLGPLYGWRLPFMLISVPSMAFSIVMLLLVEEPMRGAGEDAVRNAIEAKKMANAPGGAVEVMVDAEDEAADDDEVAAGAADDGHNSGDEKEEDAAAAKQEGRDPPAENDSGSSSGNNNNNNNNNNSNIAAKQARSAAAVVVAPPAVEEDVGVYHSNFTCEKMCDIFRGATNMLVYASELPSAMGWGVLFAFLTDFVATDKLFGVQNATTCVTLLGVGLAIGAVGGGILGQHFNNSCKTFPGSVALLTGFTMMLGPLPYYWVIYSDFGCEYDEPACLEGNNVSLSASPDDPAYVEAIALCKENVLYTVCPVSTWAVLIVLLFVSGLCLGVPTANVRAMLLNTNLPETRGTAIVRLTLRLGGSAGGGGRGGMPCLDELQSRRGCALHTCAWACPRSMFRCVLVRTVVSFVGTASRCRGRH